MAPRTKSKKKTAPIANGKNETNNSPIVVAPKKATRGRKAAIDKEIDAAAGASSSNGNAEHANIVDASPAEGVASVNNTNKTKVTKTTPAAVAAKKTKVAADAVNGSDKEQSLNSNDVPATEKTKTKTKATGKIVEPKVTGKARVRPATAAVKMEVVEELVAPAIVDNDAPALPRESKARTRKPIPTIIVRKVATAFKNEKHEVVEGPLAVTEDDVSTSSATAVRTVKKGKMPTLAGPKAAPEAIEKKAKVSTKSTAKSQPVELTIATVEVVPDAVNGRGRTKRNNAKPLETIIASPKAKRGRKVVEASAVVQMANAKAKVPKRAAFSQKSKNTASEDNGDVDIAAASPQPTTSKAAGAVPKLKRTNRQAAVKIDEPVENGSPLRKASPRNASKAAKKEPVDEVEIVPKKIRKVVKEEVVKKEVVKKEVVEQPASKSTRKKAADVKPKAEKETAAADKPKLNATKTDFAKIDFTTDKEFNMKLCSFNVAGLRAFVAKGGHEYFEHEQPNIICLQEIKCTADEVPAEAKLKNYHPYWFSKPGGRGGVAILSKNLAHHVEYGLGDEEMDNEGRIITAEFEKFYVICVYVPNAGQGLVTLPRRLRWNKMFDAHVAKLDKKKPVIICGDMNVAHTEIDLKNPKTNVKNAGFTPQEREGMTDLLALGFTDAFRYLYPGVQQAYTFWAYRGNNRIKNVGWRLDYFINSNRLNPTIVDCYMRPEVLGSDHCPINLLLNI